MSRNITANKDYRQWISKLSSHYRQSQIKATVRVNSAMLEFYWIVGRDLSQKQFLNTYGSGFFKQVSADLQRELPDVKGLSPINIRYFKSFYELYSPLLQNVPQVAENSTSEIVPQVADDLTEITELSQLSLVPWDHHRRIIDKCKGNPQKALFFVKKTVENNWSRAVLLNFLDTDLYEREGKAITNFKAVMPSPNGDLAQQITKDQKCPPLIFLFLNLLSTEDSRQRSLHLFRIQNRCRILLLPEYLLRYRKHREHHLYNESSDTVQLFC